MQDITAHLVHEHGRPLHELVGLSERVLEDLHALDHMDEHLHLTGSAHRAGLVVAA